MKNISSRSKLQDESNPIQSITKKYLLVSRKGAKFILKEGKAINFK